MSEKANGGSHSGGGLHPVVVAEVNIRFAGQDSEPAQALLANTSLALPERTNRLEIARIQMAAIKLSDGSLERLRAAMAVARTDWRDLLVAAGLADADWQQVLSEQGFGVPVTE